MSEDSGGEWRGERTAEARVGEHAGLLDDVVPHARRAERAEPLEQQAPHELHEARAVLDEVNGDGRTGRGRTRMRLAIVRTFERHSALSAGLPSTLATMRAPCCGGFEYVCRTSSRSWPIVRASAPASCPFVTTASAPTRSSARHT